MVKQGNPKGIRDFGDLSRDVTFVNRQRGAGTRLLLDHELRNRGISPGSIRGYQREEYTHMAVASAVKSGAADVGLGILAAARALGLDFIPVAEEPYELLISREAMENPSVMSLMGVICSDEFKSGLEALGGYDTRETGREYHVRGGVQDA